MYHQNMSKFDFLHGLKGGQLTPVFGHLKAQTQQWGPGGGGQKDEILSKNLYFEGILEKFQQKGGGGGSCPTPGSTSPNICQHVF